jgi:hypothetical protein
MLDRNLARCSSEHRSITVEEGAVCFYGKAIGEDDPIYSHTAAARDAGHPSLCIPPTFFSCLEGRTFETGPILALAKIDLKRLLQAKRSYGYRAPAYAGDTLFYESRIVDVSDKKNGNLELLVKHTHVTNQDGTHVADMRTALVQRQDL